MKGKRRAFIGPDGGIFLGRFGRACAQDDAVKNRPPDEARQLYDARIGEELGEIAAHSLGRGRRRGAEVDEKNALQRVGEWKIGVRPRQSRTKKNRGLTPIFSVLR
jgi:hypothetical protein